MPSKRRMRRAAAETARREFRFWIGGVIAAGLWILVAVATA